MFETIFLPIFTAIAGAIATVWSYWAGRKKQASENAKDKANALQDLDNIIDKQSHRINELQTIRLELEDMLNHAQRKNKRLESSTETALEEVNRLLNEIKDLQEEAKRIKQEAEELKQNIIDNKL